jgi:3-hydroxymyristoyl/3-hydroxydecanoyl-(acyl carrier protein) dehydratase
LGKKIRFNDVHFNHFPVFPVVYFVLCHAAYLRLGVVEN